MIVPEEGISHEADGNGNSNRGMHCRAGSGRQCGRCGAARLQGRVGAGCELERYLRRLPRRLGPDLGRSWRASISTTGYASPVFETQNLNLKGNGPLFGGQLGFNWQVNPSWVIGIEGDITGTGLKSSATGTPMCMTPFCNPSVSIAGASQYMAQDINWLASLRGRLGYSWGSSLVYVTGGAAWANISYRADSADAVLVCNGGGGGGAGCSYPAAFDTTKTGWAVGAGYEAMITANWSFRAEYLFYSFGGTTASAAGTPAAACQVADL